MNRMLIFVQIYITDVAFLLYDSGYELYGLQLRHFPISIFDASYKNDKYGDIDFNNKKPSIDISFESNLSIYNDYRKPKLEEIHANIIL